MSRTREQANQKQPVVYEIVFQNGKIYVGKTSNRPNNRLVSHKRDARNGKQGEFYDALRAEPEPTFTIVEVHATESDALRAEIARINHYTAMDICLNRRRSIWGNGVGTDSTETREKKRLGRLGKRHSENTKQLLREHNLGKPNFALRGKIVPDELRVRIGETLTKYVERQGEDYRRAETNPNWKGDGVSPKTKRNRERDFRMRSKRKFNRHQRNRNYILRANSELTPFDCWIG